MKKKEKKVLIKKWIFTGIFLVFFIGLLLVLFGLNGTETPEALPINSNVVQQFPSCTIITVPLPIEMNADERRGYFYGALVFISPWREFPVILRFNENCSVQGERIYETFKDLPVKNDCVDENNCFVIYTEEKK